MDKNMGRSLRISIRAKPLYDAVKYSFIEIRDQLEDLTFIHSSA